MAEHAFLPPSGAAAWSRCAQWPSMNATYPQGDSPESIEGTAAHWVGTEMYAGRTPLENSTAPNGVIVTGEMLDGAEVLCDVVRRRMVNVPVHVEQRVTIKGLPGEQFGTPDYWAFDRVRRHLEIIDYKFGHGYVDESFNRQGLLYMLGIIAELGDCAEGDIGAWSVAFTIVQPRCYYRGEPVRTHAYTIREAYPLIEKLKEAARAALEPQPVATTNSECRNCPGRHACSALQLAAYSDAEFSNNRAPHNLTPQAASLELRMLERALARLQARVESLQELTLANLRAGCSIPHHRAEQGKGRQQWTRPFAELVTLGKLFGKDLVKPALVTPAQARKLGIDEAVISAYSQIIPSSTKLVAENNSEAAKVFAKPGA